MFMEAFSEIINVCFQILEFIFLILRKIILETHICRFFFNPYD